MPEIKRKPGETFEAYFRRFTKTIQQSGRLIQSRKVKYLSKDKSKLEQRKSALMKKEICGKKDYLLKIGKITEEERKYGKFKKRK
ncbi:hypothetical protein KAI52_03535 [Candidatus Parcubacteria bacterium]|nr:hypothetical protein [Candidatus Parcubacteria bacterium]